MAKAKQAQEESVILTPKQARAVIALQFEREEIARQANEQIAEIVEAAQEQGRMLALVHQLPRGEGITYRFEPVAVEGEERPRVKLIAVPPATEPEPVRPAPGADRHEMPDRADQADPVEVLEEKTGATLEDIENALAAAEAQRPKGERPKGPAEEPGGDG
jgi:hypothetical protein